MKGNGCRQGGLHQIDPTNTRGTRKHRNYDITKVKMTRRYSKFDPFILSHQANQVYYLRYPGKVKDKIDWAVVVKVKPRATVEVHNTVQPATRKLR